MKKPLLLAGFCTVVLALGVPDARAGTGWLEKLSGPGPFFGIVVPIPIRCDKLSESYLAKIQANEHKNWGCDPADDTRGPRRIIGAEVWRLWTDENELPYDTDVDKGVRIFAALGTIEFAPWKQVKVGGGFGVAWFSGDTFDTFARPLAQPVRMTVAPLSLIDPRNKYLDILKIHANANIFLGGVDAGDFGSRGTFEAPYELVWSTSIEFDVIPLIVHR
jgi:hypothetical protein